ncbi:hypothetical protein GCM10010269_32810 [Streptomyces humidus]|uniref:Uncharacterized protein n=1 Tax=Streptomyces humidus TaxID=52259 RepID=A0A918FWW1_9ACTN|nr:hypothetical protein GCM10010269_32810 [Streptomyces humidus]
MSPSAVIVEGSAPRWRSTAERRNGPARGSLPATGEAQHGDSAAILREPYVGCVTFELNEGK